MWLCCHLWEIIASPSLPFPPFSSPNNHEKLHFNVRRTTKEGLSPAAWRLFSLPFLGQKLPSILFHFKRDLTNASWQVPFSFSFKQYFAQFNLAPNWNQLERRCMQKHNHRSNSRTKEPISSSRSAGKGQSSLHTETCGTRVQRQRGPMGERGCKSWVAEVTRQEHSKGAWGMGAQPPFVREGLTRTLAFC